MDPSLTVLQNSLSITVQTHENVNLFSMVISCQTVCVTASQITNSCVYLRLVFTSDEVVVGVVIRSIERYDLVKIKPTESEAEH